MVHSEAKMTRPDSASASKQQLLNGNADIQETNQKRSIEKNLCSQYEEKVRPCIDLIDSLRALGVEQDLALPAIAVIGDQSSGKSSVLEALSGVALPRGSGIVTRCPLVLKLKRLVKEDEWKGKVSYRDIEVEISNALDVEEQVRKAQNVLAGEGVGISQELVTLEVSSPHVPDLTLIDLPGITRVAVGNQPADIGRQIKTLIRKYIQRQETINLVVVPSNVDIATTEALSMAQEVDPEGDRTIGILTKPDLVDKGTEEQVVDVVRNLICHLKKGYMIVKCRGQQDIQDRLSLAEALQKEKAFFEENPYFRGLLEEGRASVPCLAERLTTELITHISKSLPLLENQIKESYQNLSDELQKYGTDIPEDETEKTFFLIEKITTFNQNITSFVQGEELVGPNDTRLFNKIRQEFQKWSGVIENNFRKDLVRDTFTKVSEKNFSEFFNLHRTTKSKLEDIKLEQENEAEKSIRLHFQMEKIVYCQDHVYRGTLQKVRENEMEEEKKKKTINVCGQNTSTESSMAEILEHLNAYQHEAGNRLSTHIPLIIQFFVLQTFGQQLQKSMLQLLQDRDTYDWLLKERNDTCDKRKFLKERLARLAQARRRLAKFPG
uniref:Interferon-induced GTP-binding protein Mx1 n=1 Tax=Equus caballus TaxID=9796 RepID=A0A3Q2KMY4_HORSE